MKRKVVISFSLFFIFFTALVHAESTVVRAGPGYAWVQEGGFEHERGAMLAISKPIHSVDISLEGMYFAEFRSKNSADSYVQVAALNPAIGKSFPINNYMSIVGITGISFWRAEATLVSNPVGSDSDTSPWIGTGIKIDNVLSNIQFYSTVEHFSDVSGRDIQLISLQAGVEF